MAANQMGGLPKLLYGTAWKKERTQSLVKQALLAGFRGIDTAAQPKHYREDYVGAGIRDALQEGRLKREDLYLQTKYTSVHGQGQDIPYDPNLSIPEQVRASVTSSLRNLRHSEQNDAYLDCLVLHSPFPRMEQTRQAWRAMEDQVSSNAVRRLGISNCYDLPVLRELYDYAVVKPSVLQNRFYADTSFDHGIREFCRNHDIVYQSFWTLTGNPQLLKSKPVRDVAAQAGVSAAVALYSLVLDLGNVQILNGTTNVARMREDLEGVEAVERWSGEHASSWNQVREAFQNLLK